MTQATLRFYAGLNLFLPPEQRQRPIPYPLNGPTTVKHAVESAGIPHTEVEAILVNSQPVDFDYLLEPADRASIYPPFTRLDVDYLPLRPPLPQPIRFVLDVHLGQLATYLRILGFDTLYRNDFDDPELADISHDQQRVLLTRDRRLLMRRQVVYGFCLRTRDPEQQLEAVLRRYRLLDDLDPWSRCLRCNGRLRPVPKEQVLDRLQSKTRKYYDEFHICTDCNQVYWKGSHFERMQHFVERVRSNNGQLS